MLRCNTLPSEHSILPYCTHCTLYTAIMYTTVHIILSCSTHCSLYTAIVYSLYTFHWHDVHTKHSTLYTVQTVYKPDWSQKQVNNSKSWNQRNFLSLLWVTAGLLIYGGIWTNGIQDISCSLLFASPLPLKWIDFAWWWRCIGEGLRSTGQPRLLLI